MSGNFHFFEQNQENIFPNVGYNFISEIELQPAEIFGCSLTTLFIWIIKIFSSFFKFLWRSYLSKYVSRYLLMTSISSQSKYLYIYLSISSTLSLSLSLSYPLSLFLIPPLSLSLFLSLSLSLSSSTLVYSFQSVPIFLSR